MGFFSKLLGRDDNIMVAPPVQQTNSNTAAQAANSGDYAMKVSDVFSIIGRGTVATGRLT